MRRQMDGAHFLSSVGFKILKIIFRVKTEEGPFRSHSFGLSPTELDQSIDLCLINNLLNSPNPPWSISLHQESGMGSNLIVKI